MWYILNAWTLLCCTCMILTQAILNFKNLNRSDICLPSFTLNHALLVSDLAMLWKCQVYAPRYILQLWSFNCSWFVCHFSGLVFCVYLDLVWPLKKNIHGQHKSVEPVFNFETFNNLSRRDVWLLLFVLCRRRLGLFWFHFENKWVVPGSRSPIHCWLSKNWLCSSLLQFV